MKRFLSDVVFVLVVELPSGLVVPALARSNGVGVCHNNFCN